MRREDVTRFMPEQSEVLSETQELRPQLLAVLTDADLGFGPADGCLPLGELCREIGEVQQTYIDSFSHLQETTSVTATTRK